MATTDKYDRQLRLWGASGQRALGNTTVVLIGSSACGTETLKNLVLPGVATFVIVDDDDIEDANDNGSSNNRATRDDLSSQPTVRRSPELTDSMLKFAAPSSNFFVSPVISQSKSAASTSCSPCLSKSARASALLSELNPDVQGYYVTVSSLESMNYSSFIQYIHETFHDSTTSTRTVSSSEEKKMLVISADQPSSISIPLSHACYMHSVPLILARSYGLLGYVRIQTPHPYHPIIDARPAHKLPDLRLSSWPLFDGLHTVASSIGNLEEITDTKDHSHVPFVIILLQALEKWRRKKSGDDGIVAGLSSEYTAASTATSHSTDVDNGQRALLARTPQYPKTMEEKEEFRCIIKTMAKNLNNEMNFQEALREAHMIWADGRVSEDVKIVLDRVDEELFFKAAIEAEMMEVDDVQHPASMPAEGSPAGANNNIIAGSSDGMTIPTHVLQFQLLALALKRFLASHDNYPPLEGTIPDMTSDTARYVSLQEAYKQQAEKDRMEFLTIVVSLLDDCRCRSNGCNIRVSMPSDEELLTFCKNSRYIRILETRPYFTEYPHHDPGASATFSTIFDNSCSSLATSMSNKDAIQSDVQDDLIDTASMDPYDTDHIQTPLLWWIALRACDAFYDRHQHYPGKHDQELALEADTNEVYNCMIQIVTSMGLADVELIKDNILDPIRGKDVAREVVRYNEAEIHTVAAVIGGVASQEAVKLITGQYLPLNDTYVFNGIASVAGVYRF